MDHASIPLARVGRPKTAARVILFPEAYAALMEVATSGLPVETAGLLIGTLQEQGGYTWVWVRSVQPVPITYDSLQPGIDQSSVAAVRDAVASGAAPRPVGWFYSDPGMGVFSPRLNLREVHRSFGPGVPVLLALNPSTEQGVFLAWRGDAFVPTGGFYEALAREGAAPTIPWGGGLPSNWHSLAEGTGLLGEGDGAHGFDLDTAPDASGGSDEWTDKFNTSPFSSAPYDLPSDGKTVKQSGPFDTPPHPITIDDLMESSPSTGQDDAPGVTAAPPSAQTQTTGPLPPLPEAEGEAEVDVESASEQSPSDATPPEHVEPEVPGPQPPDTLDTLDTPAQVTSPVVPPEIALPQPAAQHAQEAPIVQAQAANKPKPQPDLDIRYTSIAAAKTAQSAVMSESLAEPHAEPHAETRRLDDLRDYIRTIDPQRQVDPEEEARWLGELRSGQLNDDALRSEILRQKRERSVPLLSRIRPFVLPVLMVAALAAALIFGWPALTAAVQNLNRPEPTPVPVVQPALATPEQARTFPETGFTVSQPLLGFWRANGELPIFGYPISELLTESSAQGDAIEVQYFERARLELHPEAAGRADYVRTGPLGTEAPKPGTPLPQLPEGLAGPQVLFDDTNITVPEKFFRFWENSGGRTIFGPPVTGVLTETVGSTPLVVQYFERARFEYHPEAAGTPGEITLGLLGAEIYRQKHPGQ